jgi:hypothetical protein
MERANDHPKLTAVRQRLFGSAPAEQRHPAPAAPADAGAQPVPLEPDTEDESPVHTAAYGFRRGRGGVPFLEFQPRGGEWLTAAYADLRRMRWLPSGGQGRGAAFILEFRDGLKVEIRGRSLRVVLEAMQRQAVFRVTEMGEDTGRFLPDDTPVVTAIVIEEPQDDRD